VTAHLCTREAQSYLHPLVYLHCPGGDYLSQRLGHLLVNVLHTSILAGRFIHPMHQIQVNFGLDLPLQFKLHKIW